MKKNYIKENQKKLKNKDLKIPKYSMWPVNISNIIERIEKISIKKYSDIY